MSIRNWTACTHFEKIMGQKLQQIRNTRQLLFEIAQGEEKIKQKRGLLNFVGKLSKVLFGTMDDDDAQFYHENIERFEQGTTTLTQLMKQQLLIVKSTLSTINETVTDVEYNESKMKEGLSQLQAHVANFESFRKHYSSSIFENCDRKSYSVSIGCITCGVANIGYFGRQYRRSAKGFPTTACAITNTPDGGPATQWFLVSNGHNPSLSVEQGLPTLDVPT
jgi:hypothetical protein